MTMSETDNLPEGGTENAHPSSDDTGFEWDYYDPDDDQDNVEPPAESATETEDQQDQEEVEQSEEETAGETPEEDENGEPETEEEEGTEDDLKGDVRVTMTDGSEVTLDELKAGYLRQADYSRKTAEVAEGKREVTTQRHEVSEFAKSVLRNVEAVDNFIRSRVPSPPSPDLAQEDFVAYVQQKAVYDAAMDQLQGLQETMRSAQETVQTVDQSQIQQRRQQELQKLSEAIPDVNDPVKRKAFYDSVVSVAEKAGMTEQEVREIADHRFFILADLAAKGVKAEQAREKAKKKAAGAPPVPPQKRSRGATQKSQRDAMKRLAQSGSIHDAVMIDFD